MTLLEISSKLEAAGCIVKTSGSRIYVKQTPSGARGEYGYCVEGDDVRDITVGVVKRNGEIKQLLAA